MTHLTPSVQKPREPRRVRVLEAFAIIVAAVTCGVVGSMVTMFVLNAREPPEAAGTAHPMPRVVATVLEDHWSTLSSCGANPTVTFRHDEGRLVGTVTTGERANGCQITFDHAPSDFCHVTDRSDISRGVVTEQFADKLRIHGARPNAHYDFACPGW